MRIQLSITENGAASEVNEAGNDAGTAGVPVQFRSGLARQEATPVARAEGGFVWRGGKGRSMRIAILDPDPSHAEFASDALTFAGYVCHHFSQGKMLLNTLRRETFDLIVLDHAIPDVPGLEVLKRIRDSISHRVPVVFLTSHKRESDETATLNGGADDFMTKPIEACLLRARVFSILRRVYGLDRGNEVEIFGEYKFNTYSSSLTKDGIPIRLTQREFDLTHLLFQSMGVTLSRDHIQDLIWKIVPIAGSRTVDIHVSRIRKKLGLSPENGYRLASIHGCGYRLDRV
jgi:DNA-binding response OmpR family regulator